jgi:hypothetical protein
MRFARGEQPKKNGEVKPLRPAQLWFVGERGSRPNKFTCAGFFAAFGAQGIARMDALVLRMCRGIRHLGRQYCRDETIFGFH